MEEILTESELLESLVKADGFIQVNRLLIKKFKLMPAILLGELLSERNYWRKEDKLVISEYKGSSENTNQYIGTEFEWFYSTRQNLEENTGMTVDNQRTAQKKLEDAKVLLCMKVGLPAVNYYAINDKRLLAILKGEISINDKSCDNSMSSSSEPQQLDKSNPDLNNNKYNNKNKVIGKPITAGSPASSTKIKHSRDFRNHTNFLNDTLGDKDRLEEEKKEAEKPKKKNLYQKCYDSIADTKYGFSLDVQQSLKDFLNVCLNNKYISGINQWDYKLKALVKLSKDSNTQIQIIEQSINEGLVGFSPLGKIRQTFDKSQYNKSNSHEASEAIYKEATAEELKAWRESDLHF